MKINKVIPANHDYLQILTHIAKKPQMLYCSGVLPPSRLPTVAIVGTRKPTAYGKEVTTRIASELARRGVVVISGLALGVDGIAHTAVLEAGGPTIAILANGLPDIYPSTHRGLAANIIKSGGAILTEYPGGTSPRPYQFLERNRLVSGLADAVIVTEAAARSGTLNTVMHALEQGKEVFAVPGNITSPMSAGCNALIRQGATPLIDVSQVLESIAPALLHPQTQLSLGQTKEESIILGLLQEGIRDGEQLSQQSKLDSQVYSQTMTMLELSGSIRSLGANQWTLN